MQAWQEARPRPLFVDDWQFLHIAAKRELVRFSAEQRLPVILVDNGEAFLADRPRHNIALVGEVSSRILCRFTVAPLSDEDCDGICIARNVDGPPARLFVRRLAASIGFRRLNALLDHARIMVGNRGSIKLKHLHAAANTLLGDTARARQLTAPQKDVA